METNGSDPPTDVAGWRYLDDDARRLIIAKLEPVMREIASSLGASTRAERRDVLEAIGLASLTAAGWAILAAPGEPADPGAYL